MVETRKGFTKTKDVTKEILQQCPNTVNLTNFITRRAKGPFPMILAPWECYERGLSPCMVEKDTIFTTEKKPTWVILRKRANNSKLKTFITRRAMVRFR